MNSGPEVSSHRFSARSKAIASVVILALVLTILNAIKPLTLDDNAYSALARQIATPVGSLWLHLSGRFT